MSDLQSSPWALAGAAGVILYLSVSLSLKNYRATSRGPYPPGPRGYPIINNLLDIPKLDPWKAYTEMSKQYGDMIFFRVFSQPILILCSSKRINDLLDNRSSTYSGRIQSVMAGELLDFRTSFPFMGYTAKWRKHRKMFHQHYNPSVVQQYHPLIKRHIHKFLSRMLDSPTEFEKHTQLFIGGSLMNIGYGFGPQSRDDSYLSEVRDVADAFKVAGLPGQFLVDYIPLLKYIPAWFPGAGFKKWAAYYRDRNNSSKDRPFNFVKEAMKRNEAEPCVLTRILNDMPRLDGALLAEEESDIKNVLGIAYLAGTDTTNSIALTFILVMAMYPEYQKKAQEELDSIVGPNSLPEFEQEGELVYMKAILTELLRWFQVFPLAFPHMTTEDDHYDGCFVPKGTLVLGNSWSVLHDPAVFDNPMEFKPERYLTELGAFNKELLNPHDYAFGFGRRICPGSALSMDFLYMMAASTLAMFDILPPKDASGVPIKLEASFDNGIFVNANPFECIIQPRSVATESAIRKLVD